PTRALGGAHGRTHHLSVGRQHGGTVRSDPACAGCRRSLPLWLRRRIRGGVISALSGREVLAVFRREHLSFADTGTGLFRSGQGPWWRPDTRAGQSASIISARVLHDGLALSTRQLARDRARAA